MRTLIDGRCLRHTNVDGVQRYVTDLMAELTRLGMRFDLAEPRAAGRWGQQAWEHLALPRTAKGYDVLFCPGNVAPLRMPRGTKLVVTVHSLSVLKLPEAYRWAFRAYYRFLMPRVIRKADAVITVSQAQAREIADAFPQAAGKLHAIPLAVSDAFQAPAQPQREPVVLFVGSLGPVKNLRGVLAAFAEIADRVPHRLSVVGASHLALKSAGDIAEAASRIGADRVDWVGQVNDRAALVGMYQRATLLVFPSLYESFGLPALEAMACGTPVLASDIPALRETVADAGVFVDPHDVSAIADAMLELLTDAERGDDLRERGIRRAAAFSWERCARQTWDVINDSGSGMPARV